MAAGRGDGIDLDTPFRWVIEGIEQPEKFMRHLPSLLPADAILCFEGGSIARDVSEFYESHRVRNAVAVVRDTIFPVPDFYHVAFSPDVVTRLRSLLNYHVLQFAIHVATFSEQDSQVG
jgi:hypothetical protein